MDNNEQLADLTKNLDKIKTTIAINKANKERLLTELKDDFDISSIDEALIKSDKIEPEMARLAKQRDKLIESANKLIKPLLERMDG